MKLTFKQNKFDNAKYDCIFGKTYSCSIRFYDCGKQYIGTLKIKLPQGVYNQVEGYEEDYIEEQTIGFSTPLEAALELERMIEEEINNLEDKIKELKNYNFSVN